MALSKELRTMLASSVIKKKSYLRAESSDIMVTVEIT